MVLTYSYSEWFVPSLQELKGPQKSSPRRCVWHKPKRSPKSDGAQLVKCSNPVAEQDAKKADRLIRELFDVLDKGERCLKVLQELSPLLLCKGVHRSSNAVTISSCWATELKLMAHSPARAAPKQTPRSPSSPHLVRRTSVDEVVKELGLRVEAPIRCLGKGRRDNTCGNWISKSNGERIAAISRELAGDWSLSSKVLKFLEELSGLVMCQRWHQDQAASKLKEWIVTLRSKEAAKRESQANDRTVIPQTPPRSSTRYSDFETPETKTSSVWTSPRQSRSPASTTTTPPSISSWDRSRPLPLDSEIHQLRINRDREPSCVSPTPISSRTRAATKANLSESKAATNRSPTFEPLSTVKSPLMAAQYVMEKIKEKVSVREFPSGFVYGFRRSGCDLIKIGTTTTTVAERLKSIGTQCKYTPILVFQVATNHAMKVERLVHRQLYRQNRRECLFDGLCNEGRGCPTRHKEFFENVSDEYAETVARAWVRWMNLEPYDADGILKEEWVVQNKLFNLTAPGDVWMRWTAITLTKTARQIIKDEEEEEAIADDIRAEKVLRTVNELSSQLVPPKLGVSKTSRIFREGHASFAPVKLSSPVDVFA